MFVENHNSVSMIDQLTKKFPNSSFSGTQIKYFGNTEEEYFTLKHGVGILLSFHKRIIKFSGKDTLDFLHRVSTNAVKDLKPFYRISTLFLNEKGRFIDRTDLLNLENYYLLVGSCNQNRLFNWVNKYIITEDIQTSDVSNEFVVVDFVGPQSESFLTLLLGDEIKSLNGDNILNPDLDGFNFFLFTHRESNGLKYYRILLPIDKLLSFTDYVIDNKSVFDLNFVGSDAYDIFRLENGIPDYPSEINDEINPHENNLINEVSFTKGCYIGQEVVARLDTYDKVQRKLTGFIFEENIKADLPITIINESNEEIGEVTSIANSPVNGKTIGLGFVRKKKLSPKEKLFIEIEAKRIYLSLNELPITK